MIDTRYLLGMLLFALLLVLVGVALWAERRARAGRDPTANPWVYTLSLTVYCTTWTFYGSVGSAANHGMLYSTVYLGPTLVMILSWGVLRRLIRLRQRFGVGSLADLVTLRYGQSEALGAFITLALLVGLVPYLSLQLRALMTSFSLLVGEEHSAGNIWQGHFADETMIVLAGIVTVAFALRSQNTRVRQTGLLAMLAVEGVLKLVSFVAVGLFVTYGLFDGFGDIERRLAADLEYGVAGAGAPLDGGAYLNWMSYLVLAMGAVLFLPRMFHVAVVENHDERHLTTAMWAFPLYLLVISLFVVPIAMGGRLLGYPASEADWLVLRLPLDLGGPGLGMVAFLGGFSAGLGILMVTCSTLAVMVSNHVVLPLIERVSAFSRFSVKLRGVRWLVVFLLLGSAYLFEAAQSDSQLLIRMGLISFAFVLQFAPVVLGGMYWQGASRVGAWCGLLLGWSIWAYTLLLPAAVPAGAASDWLLRGPFDLWILRPEHLFGLDLGSTLSHSVFWSLGANVLGFLGGSVLSPPREAEREMALQYVGVMQEATEIGGQSQERNIALTRIQGQISALLERYLPLADRNAVSDEVLKGFADVPEGRLSGGEFFELTRRLEIALAGYVGAASARQIVTRSVQLAQEERGAVEQGYARFLAELRISPEELRERIDHFRVLSEVNAKHASQLGAQLKALREESAARAHAEQVLGETEGRFRALADSAPVMIWMSDVAGGEDYFNNAWCEFAGRRAGELQGGRWTDHIHQDERDEVAAVLERALDRRIASGAIEFRLQRADGEYRWLAMRVSARLGEKGDLLGLIASAADVSEVRQAAMALQRSNDELEEQVRVRTQDLLVSLKELRESEETIRAITDSAQDAVVMLDAAGEVSFWNPAAERVFGWSSDDVLGRCLDDFLLCEEHREAHREGYARFQKGGSGSVMGRTVELEALTASGRRIPVELSLSHTTLNRQRHAVGLMRDISARKEAEALLQQSNAELKATNQRLEEAQNQLLQSEKMASIGQLAAGVAHEINNPVGFVSSNLGSLRKYVDQLLSLLGAYADAEGSISDAEARKRLAGLRDAADLEFLREDVPALLDESDDGLRRVRRIVQDLKEFSHVDKAEWHAADINAGIESTLNVVWNEVKYKAEVVKNYGELPPVECIAGQLNQVFMNLIVNAVQAIENKGTITLASGHEGDEVWVEVADTGKGMSDEVRRRVFEPFFTTKDVGKGTGLGMSLSFSIVKKHGGRIELESELGKGTRFRVWIPVKRVAPEPPAADPA